MAAMGVLGDPACPKSAFSGPLGLGIWGFAAFSGV